MKISKNKRQLAQLLIEAGVKQFPDGANWAAQDSDGGIRGHEGKPKWQIVNKYWWEGGEFGLLCRSDRIANFHQAILSRAEFDQIAAESAERSKPDADGWIEWKGGGCPVRRGTLVDVKYANGVINIGVSALTDISHSDHTCGTQPWLLATNWDGESPVSGIVAYRPHKPEQVEPQYRESVTLTIPEQVTAPTLDQLLQDYRNASDFAAAKQAEADEAAKMRDERWKAVQARACDLGVRIIAGLAVDVEMRESEPVITDWRDLRIGDVIEYVDGGRAENVGLLGAIIDIDHSYGTNKHVKMKFYDVGGCGWPTKWRFIRRP